MKPDERVNDNHNRLGQDLLAVDNHCKKTFDNEENTTTVESQI